MVQYTDEGILFDLDLVPGGVPPIIHITQYDVRRGLIARIRQNGTDFSVPSGMDIKLEGTINGHGFSVDASRETDGTISATITEDMTAFSGSVRCKFRFTATVLGVTGAFSTEAFILDCDRAGVEADTVIGAPGFEQQIVDAVNDWLDEHPPASGGMTEEFKQALLDCFENVAWIDDDGQDYYDALYAALYPPVDVLSISAVFTQGDAVIYDTDSLDDLKQYLVVTATMTDSTTQTLEDSDYTLSGTLTEGTSTITVSYEGKTTTFSVNVTERVPICSLTGNDFSYQKQLTDTSPYYKNSVNNYHRTSHTAFDIDLPAGKIQMTLIANTNDVKFGLQCISNIGYSNVLNGQSIANNKFDPGQYFESGDIVTIPSTFNDGGTPSKVRITMTSLDGKLAIPVADIVSFVMMEVRE